MPQRISGACLAKIRAPAPAREKPQDAGHHKAAPYLPVTDRDLGLGLPEVDLADLGGPVDGALVGALGGKARAHLAQVIVEDRLGALITELGYQLADAGAGNPVIGAQGALDLPPPQGRGVKRVIAAANRISGRPYVWGGGHAS
jgi:hypothetical protein